MLLFLLKFTLAFADITIFTLHNPTKEALEKVEKNISKKDTNNLLLLTYENDFNSSHISIGISLANKFYLDNLSKLNFSTHLACNVYKKGKITRYLQPYTNMKLDDIKISIIGVVEKEPLAELTLDDEAKNLEEVLGLLKTSFNPDLYIVITNVSLKKIEHILKKYNVIVFTTKEESSKYFYIKNTKEPKCVELKIKGKNILDQVEKEI